MRRRRRRDPRSREERLRDIAHWYLYGLGFGVHATAESMRVPVEFVESVRRSEEFVRSFKEDDR